MIIRLQEDSASLPRYLRMGRRLDNDWIRDEKDRRLILRGHLTLLERALCHDPVVQHMVLSFAEDHVPAETLESIVQSLEEFLFCAYESDEYLWYVEAHLPRLKSRIDEDTGSSRLRYPHLHVAIWLRNLQTGRSLRPLGHVRSQIPYLDAFQESINIRHGLISPKQRRGDGHDRKRHPNSVAPSPVEPHPAPVSIPDLEASLAHWKQHRAWEVRLLNSGDRRAYADYRASLRQEQVRWLVSARERARQCVMQHRQRRQTASVPPLKRWPWPVRDLHPAIDQRAENWLAQQRIDREERHWLTTMLRRPVVRTWLSQMSSWQVLADLSWIAGLDLRHVRPQAAPDGTPGVQCGDRWLDLVDFLRDRMHWDAPTVWGWLQQWRLRQHPCLPLPRLPQQPHVQWWQDFVRQDRSDWLPPDDEYLDGAPVDGWRRARYRHYLSDRWHVHGDVAVLQELRRLAVHPRRTPEDGATLVQIVSAEADGSGTIGEGGVEPVKGLQAGLQWSGCVTYHHRGQLVLIDTGRSIELADCDRLAHWLPWALDLARRRFGTRLAVQGQSQVCHAAIDSAEEVGCTVSLGLPAWPVPVLSGGDESPDEHADADTGGKLPKRRF
ncbi:MAG: hypothetical protein ACRCTM_04285 [Sphaerotilus sulfidivorans]|uniref:hypothetical protein n=1 Tax=Sphaerotilus sulfidivorans TaxID=639200 RepID=UPI003F3B536C